MANFSGFARPKSNFYRLPNDWFDIWHQARVELSGGSPPARILGPLKIVEYVIKYSMKNDRQMLATINFLCRGADKNIDPYRANCDALQSPTFRQAQVGASSGIRTLDLVITNHLL